jgi:AAA domain
MTKTRDEGFPPELLMASLSEKIAYFKGVKINHGSIDKAKEGLLNAIEDADSDSLIFVPGPTGVGKTTLRTSVVETIISNHLPELKLDLGRIPAVGIELPAPATGFFSWSDTLQELLRAMGEPLIEFKIPARKEFLDLHFPTGQRMNISRYRQAYERALKHRRPVAVLLDDAQYLNKVPASRLLYQLEFIKSIASSVQIPHVLLGTYELLALRNLSGQISRRSIDIHFPRYKFSDDDDRLAFARTVKSLEVKMPVECCPDLLEHLDYLMERTAGCVGLLKAWLTQSLIEALRAGATTVTREHLDKRSYSDDALTKIFMEMAEGEDRLLEGGSQYPIQRMRLEGKGSMKLAAQTNTTKGKTNKKYGKRRPGQRNPVRDQIGLDEPLMAPTA